MPSPPAARSPRTFTAATALVCFDPAYAHPARAKKRSRLEAAEEEVRKVTMSMTKLEEELEVLASKGMPTQERVKKAQELKRLKFVK